ncbi:MAG: YbhB/YbcL family Raf kinase inhibitor-like protein [Clostridiales bacterium]|nr:YbhB/YbcL family Raf kinase inhibitor-like protein [Clostridiales bacterium]
MVEKAMAGGESKSNSNTNINSKAKIPVLFILLPMVIVVAAIAAIFILNPNGGKKEEENVMEINLKVTSTAFSYDGFIPSEYSADGENISPPLTVGDVVSGAASIAIIVDDPDAPFSTFTHWLIWNIPVQYSEMPEGIPQSGRVDVLGGAIQGANDFGISGYKGPSPPSGTHTYRFKVYVLDTILSLVGGSDKKSLQTAMEGHILQYGLLRGKYARKK